MARTERGGSRAGAFFLATLLLWLISVLFEILFNRRTELIYVVAGCLFFQTANWVIRYCISRDPLFVNTSVSLLHSTITSASGSHRDSSSSPHHPQHPTHLFSLILFSFSFQLRLWFVLLVGFLLIYSGDEVVLVSVNLLIDNCWHLICELAWFGKGKFC